MDYNNIPDNLKFPKILNYETWNKYLNRPLHTNEKILIHNFKIETQINHMMKQLYEQCNVNNMYVPILTNLNGDCLFESLNYYKIGINVKQIRRILSVIMYIFKDYKNFLPNNDLTLLEMFNMINEVSYVSCKSNENKEFYKYGYNVMCQDLNTIGNWSRLPTQLILLVVSYLYKVKIVIISNNGNHTNIINAYETISSKFNIETIYLGHLAESHYVPIDILKSNQEKNVILYYKRYEPIFNEWATKMEKIIINTARE